MSKKNKPDIRGFVFSTDPNFSFEEEAIEWQNKAIELKKKQGFDPKGLEKELSDMKKGKTKPGK